MKSKEEAEAYLWTAPDLPASKQAFHAALRRAVWWYGASHGGETLWDEATDAQMAEHAEQHLGECEGPDLCTAPTSTGTAIARLMDAYWEGNA